MIIIDVPEEEEVNNDKKLKEPKQNNILLGLFLFICMLENSQIQSQLT